jgi:hypothetical protein
VTGISGTTATVSWQTHENASTYLEWGVGTPGYVTGSATPAVWESPRTVHSVTLSGLTPGATYVWRVRTGDWFRNVTRTPLATFTTTAPGAVPFPDVVAVGSVSVYEGSATNANLSWYPVAAPSGNPVEYRVQLATDSTFATLVDPLYGTPADSGWVSGTPSTLGGAPILYFQVTLTNLPGDDCSLPYPPMRPYYWRVKARDSVTGVESDWSAVDPFHAGEVDPYC